MRNNLFGRVVLGFFAAAPLFVIAFVLTILFGGRVTTFPLGRIVIVSTIAGMILYATVVSYFLYLVQTDDRLDSSDKARWTFVLLVWFPIAAIYFWYQFVWSGRSAEYSKRDARESPVLRSNK